MGINGFMYACMYNNVQIVRFLIDQKVDTEVKSEQGTNGFIIACLENNMEVIKLLIDKKIDIKHTTFNGNSGLNFLSNKNKQIIL